jgi:hypothetical protein
MIGSASSALVTAVSVPGVSVSVTGVGSYLPVSGIAAAMAGIASAMAGVAAMAAGLRSTGPPPANGRRDGPPGVTPALSTGGPSRVQAH